MLSVQEPLNTRFLLQSSVGNLDVRSMKNTPRLILFTGLIMTVGLCNTSLASTMYRYKDNNDRMVISNTVPSEATNRGYEVLNDHGRVIRVIDPAPTQAEIDARKAKKEQALADKERAREDAELLRTYSHPDEAVLALRRKIQELNSLVQLKRGNISVIQSQLDEQQSKAADIERSGRDVPEAILTRVDRLNAQIRDIKREISAQKMDTEAIRKRFEVKIERLEKITGEERTLSLNPGNTKQ